MYKIASHINSIIIIIIIIIFGNVRLATHVTETTTATKRGFKGLGCLTQTHLVATVNTAVVG